MFGRAWIGPSGTDWVFTGSLAFPGNVLALFDAGTALVDRDDSKWSEARGRFSSTTRGTVAGP